MEHLKKMVKYLREEMDKRDIEEMVVADSSNLSYITGINDISGVLKVENDGWKLHTSKFYRYSFRGVSNVEIYPDRESRKEVVSGFEGCFADVRKIGETEFEHNSVISEMREVKKNFEIKNIRNACRTGDRVFERVVEQFGPGMSEMDVVGVVDSGFRDRGVYNSFETLAHRNTLEPHRPSSRNRIIETGDLVLLDMGCRRNNYCSDMTRMVPNEVSGKRKGLVDDVLEIQRMAVKSVKPGMEVSELCDRVREMVEDKGYTYDKHFLHGLGHGVGVDIHEKPFLSDGSDHELEKGNVITVEPGLYVPDIGGVRIEDTVVVENEGCTVLTESERGI